MKHQRRWEEAEERQDKRMTDNTTLLRKTCLFLIDDSKARLPRGNRLLTLMQKNKRPFIHHSFGKRDVECGALARDGPEAGRSRYNRSELLSLE
jgi:predicted metal-binding protein